MSTGDTRIASECVGFRSYEDLGTNSANLTKYLFKEGQLEPTTTATHLNRELLLFLPSICRLQRQRDIYFYFSPVEIAKLLFSSLKKLEITPVIHRVLQTIMLFGCQTHKRYPP